MWKNKYGVDHTIPYTVTISDLLCVPFWSSPSNQQSSVPYLYGCLDHLVSYSSTITQDMWACFMFSWLLPQVGLLGNSNLKTYPFRWHAVA
jgi:hypothetical protein